MEGSATPNWDVLLADDEIYALLRRKLGNIIPARPNTAANTEMSVLATNTPPATAASSAAENHSPPQSGNESSPSSPAPESQPASDAEMEECETDEDTATSADPSTSESESSSSADSEYTVVGPRKRARLDNNDAPNKAPRVDTESASASSSRPASRPASPKPKGPHHPRAPLQSQPAPQPAPQAYKPPVPPPLVIRNKDKWLPISAWCNTNRVSYRSARSTFEGIRVNLATSDDHRKLTAMLLRERIPYHTFTLPEERKLRVVIKGVPVELTSDSIKESLLDQSLPVIEVHRMVRGYTRAPYEMVMAVLDLTKNGKDIYRIKTVCGLSGITVEPPHRKGMLSQCHRCQLYGHSSRNCHARPRCVKCLEDHATADCARPKANDPNKSATPASCVLCGQVGHPANYRGCPRAPRPVIRRPPPPPRYPSVPQPPPKPYTPPKNPWVKTTSSVEFPPLPNKNIAPAPAIATPPSTNNSLPKAPTVGHKQPPTAGLPKPHQGNRSSNTQAVFTTGFDTDLAVVKSFAAILNVDQIREIAAELRQNQGNSLALLNTAIKFSSVLENLNKFTA